MIVHEDILIAIAEELAALSPLNCYFNIKTHRFYMIPSQESEDWTEMAGYSDALSIINSDLPNFIILDPPFPYQKFDFMQAFAEQIGDEGIKQALTQPKPFRHFKQALRDLGGDMIRQWGKFEVDCHVDYIKQLLSKYN